MSTLRSLPAPALLLVVLAGAACSPSAPLAPVETGGPAGALAAPGVELARPAGDVVADRFASQRGYVDLSFQRLTRVGGTFLARTTLTGQEPGPWVEARYAIERQVIGVQTPVAGGPTYRQERVRHLEDTGPSTSLDLWRQDRTGLFLYQADAAVGPAPLALARRNAVARAATSVEAAALARAWDEIAAKRAVLLAGRPGGPLDDEITFLRYPLHRGATWEGRPGFNVWTVEALEWIDTPGGRFHAARLRIELPELFGPLDRALSWWDAPGEVKRAWHLFGHATDGQGTVIGEIETIETFELVAYEPNAPL